MRVGWIGLGIMGSQMLPHIINAGHQVTVLDARPEAAEPFVRMGASRAESRAALAGSVDVVISIVGMPSEVEQVYLASDGIVAAARPGTVLVEMTTSRPDIARRIFEAASARGVEALDAPVSGGPAGAESGGLSIMVGGRAETLERVRPLLSLLGSTIIFQGGPGSGQSAKIANQIALGGAMLGICEAFLFAQAAGLDSDTVLDTIQGGIAGSNLVSYVWPRIASGDMAPGFRVEHMIKDLGLALDAAHDGLIALPGTALVKELYHAVQAAGGGGMGTQSLVLALPGSRRNAANVQQDVSTRAHRGSPRSRQRRPAAANPRQAPQ